jgi:dihydrodipicolinate synthase/N-acetylneuraminate lyase
MLSKLEARDRFQGVVVPLATLFNDDLSIDVQGTADNAQWIVDRGARQGNTVFLIAGSGGDFTVLNMEERKQVIEAVAKVGRDNDVPMMAGVQSTDIRDTITLCQLAEDNGVEIAQISGAYYYTVQDDDTIAWHEEVARHTGIGFSAYSHWYSGSKYDVPVEVIDRLLEIPNTNAVKWGSPNIDGYVQGLMKWSGKSALVNNGSLVIYAAVLGCKAWISHVPNFYPEFCWRTHDLMEQGRFTEAQEFFEGFMGEYGRVRGAIGGQTAGEGIFVKAAMDGTGRRGGPSRLPSRDAAVSQDTRDAFQRLVESHAGALSAV